MVEKMNTLKRISSRISKKREDLEELTQRQELQEKILKRVSSTNNDFDSQHQRIIDANLRFGFNEYHLKNERIHSLPPFLNHYVVFKSSDELLTTPFSESQLKRLRRMSEPLIHRICNLALEYNRGYGMGACISFADGVDPINLILNRKMDEKTYNSYLVGAIPVFERKTADKKYLFIGDTRKKDYQKRIEKETSNKNPNGFFSRLFQLS